MEKIIVNDIIPILVIMILGYICGRMHFFDDDQRQGLNKLVLNIALPAALFISIVAATREMFIADGLLTILSIVGVTGMFMVSFFLCKLLFHHTTQEAAVCAMIAGSPTIGFLGFAVLDPIYGDNVTTNLVIGIVSIVVNAVTIPIGLALINKGQSDDRKKALATAGKGGTTVNAAAAKATTTAKAAAVAAPAASAATEKTPEGAPVTDDEAKAASKKGIMKEIDVLRAEVKGHGKKHVIKNSNLEAVVNALKQPVAAAPLLAVLFVLLGIRVPVELDPCFNLIAKANSGVAVLAAGLALSTVKFSVDKEALWNTFFRLLLTPAVIVAVAFLLGMGSDPTKISMLCLANALPPAFSGIIISSRYNIYVKEGANSVALSTIGFAATCVLWVWLMPVLCTMFH